MGHNNLLNGCIDLKLDFDLNLTQRIGYAFKNGYSLGWSLAERRCGAKQILLNHYQELPFALIFLCDRPKKWPPPAHFIKTVPLGTACRRTIQEVRLDS
jgi:hypothetical protein